MVSTNASINAADRYLKTEPFLWWVDLHNYPFYTDFENIMKSIQRSRNDKRIENWKNKMRMFQNG